MRPALSAGLSGGSPWVEKVRHLFHGGCCSCYIIRYYSSIVVVVLGFVVAIDVVLQFLLLRSCRRPSRFVLFLVACLVAILLIDFVLLAFPKRIMPSKLPTGFSAVALQIPVGASALPSASALYACQ